MPDMRGNRSRIDVNGFPFVADRPLALFHRQTAANTSRHDGQQQHGSQYLHVDLHSASLVTQRAKTLA